MDNELNLENLKDINLEKPLDDHDYRKQFEYWKTVQEKIDVKALSSAMQNTEFEDKNILKAMGSFTLEMKDEFKGGQYKTILSDDHSGRTAALFAREMMTGKNGKVLDIRGVSGIYPKDDANNAAMREYLEKIAPEIGKTLLVVESIDSGKRIEELCRMLDDLKIDYKVATVALCNRPEYYREKKMKFIDKCRFGEISRGGQMILDLKCLGLEKDPCAISAHDARDLSVPQPAINKHRKNIEKIATEMKKLLD